MYVNADQLVYTRLGSMSLMTAQKTAPGPQGESPMGEHKSEGNSNIKCRDTPNSDTAENIRLCERNDVLKAK